MFQIGDSVSVAFATHSKTGKLVSILPNPLTGEDAKHYRTYGVDLDDQIDACGPYFASLSQLTLISRQSQPNTPTVRGEPTQAFTDALAAMLNEPGTKLPDILINGKALTRTQTAVLCMHLQKVCEPDCENTPLHEILTIIQHVKTAEERGHELMRQPLMSLPKRAIAYATYLAGKAGSCSEVMLAAWITYAQLVEGFACQDPIYTPNADAVAWFAANP